MHMNEPVYKKIFSVIFVISLFAYMTIALSSLKMNQVSAMLELSSGWDAKAAYPFQTETEENVEEARVSTGKRMLQLINKVKTGVKYLVTSENPLYTGVTIIRKTLDRNIYGYNATTSLAGTENDLSDPRDLVVLHESGFLSFVYDKVDVDLPLENIRIFSQYLSDKGIDLLLFIPPYKSGKIDSTYRGVYHDYSGELLHDIVQKAQQYGVDVIDFQNIAESEGLTEEEIYFKTDHHWLPQSGLLGCKAVSPWLIDRGYEIDTGYFELSNYNVNYAKYPMLGSQGIKVTSAYTDVEYLPILEPLYPTDLTVTNAKAGTVVTGSIGETLYDYRMVETPSLDSTKHFQFYSYGDPPLLQIHNEQRTDGKRILVIKDSFARVMVPYMCNMAEYVDVIDLRHFNGSLKTYMEENMPDSVIVIYAVGTYIDQSHYVEPDEYAFNFE